MWNKIINFNERLVYFVVSAILIGCVNSSTNKTVQVLNFCTARKIVNGNMTDNFPSVVRLHLEGTRTCTGTFISSDTLITARHCLLNTLTVNALGQSTSLFFLSDKSLDLALVKFPENTFRGIPSELSQENFKGNEPITLVGFGQYDVFHNIPTDGKKRMGCNTLQGFANITDKKIHYRADTGQYLHTRSLINEEDGRGMAGQGDSGGPLFIGDKLAGIVSFGGERNKLLSSGEFEFFDEPHADSNSIYEFDTNLNSSAAVHFLKSVK